MARKDLTTSWAEVATGKTAAFVQNVGDNVAQVAFAGSSPASGTDAGFVLQKGDYLSLSGIASTDIHARGVGGASELEYVTD